VDTTGQCLGFLSRGEFTKGCSVLGIEAPLFLWVGCFVLFVTTFIFLFRLFYLSHPIITTLKRLTRKIGEIQPINRPLDGVGLEELRLLMQDEKLVADAWGEFDETLLVHRDERQEFIFNTGQADDYFSKEALLGGRINLSFYAAYPGILTSVGLLLTFVAILYGLSGIKLDGGEAGKIVGVETLVTSLSGKFISSICALGLAVIFTFVEKRRESLISESVHGFIRALNRKLSRRPAEHILQLIQRDISEQSIAFRQFGTDLSGHLKESFSESMGPHFQKVAEAVEELRRQKSESITDSLAQVVSEFKGALMGSTNSEFKSLESTLARTAETLNVMNSQSKASQEKMSEVLESLDAAISKQSSTGQEHLARLATTMEMVIDKLQNAASESSTTLGASVASMIQQLKAGFSEQSAEMARRNDELASLMRVMIEQFQSSLNQSSSSVSSTAQTLMEKSSEFTTKATDQIISVLEQQTLNAQAIADARVSLNDALNIFREAISEGAATLDGMGSASSSVKDGMSILNNALKSLEGTQDKATDLVSLVDKNANNLRSVIDSQAEIVTKYESVVRELDRSLSSVLMQVTSSIENYSSKVKSSLQDTLSQFDEHLTNATSKLGGTVQDLSESLEDLVDLASRSKGAST
jgi:methyl-accepting chemotaxis protein